MSEALTNDIRTEANTALLEVDKGIRSTRVGEQCEAIVKFPALMDRFPFPILINAAFLKLADVFRNCANLLRLNILQVLQLSEKHLNKITSVDEFLRRISTVIHSNDPIARAITLRVFGNIAGIIAERKSVHHSIHRSLESNDQVEVEAAIFATSCLSQHSSTFAAAICEKIASMVQGLTTPNEMKLRLIPVLKQMHHDINTAVQVRELCLKLLPSYPSLSFVSSILSTLTELAIATLVHVPDQVKLLLGYAQSDARHSVRMLALCQLYKMSNEVPHVWTREMCEALLSVSERAVNQREREQSMRVLLRLSNSIAVHSMNNLKDDILLHCYSTSCNTAVYAMATVTNIIVETTTEASTNEMADESHMPSEEVEEMGRLLSESLLVLDFSQNESNFTLKVLLSSLTKLAKNPVVGRTALDTVMSLLSSFPDSLAGTLNKALVSIATTASEEWAHVTPKLLGYLDTKGPANTHEILPPVATVLMQLHSGAFSASQRRSFLSSALPTLLDHVWAMSHSSRFWVAYKVARRASMMGFHELAEPIYLKLSTMVTVVRYRHWLNALQQFSLAQDLLSSSSSSSSSRSSPSVLIPTLSKASAIICNASVLIKASSPPSSFPLLFLSAYTALLNTHFQLLSTCVSVHTIPPPSAGPLNSTEKKFQSCMSQFQTQAEQFSTLYSSLFDADPSTLEYITLLQQSCLLMASVISSVVLSRKPLVSPAKVMTPIAEPPSASPEMSNNNFSSEHVLGVACKNVLQYAQNAATSLHFLHAGEEHASVLSECSEMILATPLKLPPYFFISLQQTSIKLVLSPPLPPSGQRINVSSNSHLALKVEGVIEHSGRKKVYRSPHTAHMAVIPTLKKALSSDMKQPELTALERSEPVNKDYFQAQFLLCFPVPGHYSVSVEASLIDEEGRVWHTGPRVDMAVMMESEETSKYPQQQQQHRAPQQSSGASVAKSAAAGTHRM